MFTAGLGKAGAVPAELSLSSASAGYTTSYAGAEVDQPGGSRLAQMEHLATQPHMKHLT